MNLLNTIKALAKKNSDNVIAIRRHLHQHPELSFNEFSTSAYICSILDEHQISYKSTIVKTGIVAIIEGNNPTKKTILLRADMDALPIEEKNEISYASQNKGVMHACGHDAHSAAVLGAAIILKQLKHDFEGTVKIMFQPGEEVLPGGASLMINENVLKNPTVNLAIAQHVFPSMEVGKVGFKSGMYMASTDEVHITITGKGGHAAMPADYINPIISAATIIKQVEEQFKFVIDDDGVARNTQNNLPTVIAFGKIEANGATNVIAESVYIAGTIRTMNEAWRLTIKKQLTEIINVVCETYNTKAQINIVDGYPFLINDAATTLVCKQAAIDYLGQESVEELPLRMTAEDFAYITQQVPSCFFRLGTGNTEKGITAGVHTATFNIDEDALEISSGLLAWMCIKNL